MRGRVATTAVVLALCAAGCGGGGGSGSSSSGTSAGSSASKTPSGPAFPSAAAQTAAEQALLTISDFPSGWSTSKDTSDDSGDKQFEKQLSDCLHAPPGLLGHGGKDSANADSPNFDSPDTNTTVSESVSVAASDRVDQLFSVLEQGNVPDCLSTTLNALIKQQVAKSNDPDIKKATIGSAEVGQLSAGHYGDDTVAFRTKMPIEAQGLSISIYFDLLFVRHSNAVAIMSFEGEGTPVDTQTTDKYTQLATTKMTQTAFPTA